MRHLTDFSDKGIARYRLTGLLLFAGGSLFFSAWAGYDAFSWHVRAKSWVTVTATFDYQSPKNKFGAKALARYSFKNQPYSAQIQISREQVLAYTSREAGEPEPLVLLRVQPDKPSHVIADPSQSINEDLERAFFFGLIALIWYFFANPILQLYRSLLSLLHLETPADEKKSNNFR